MPIAMRAALVGLAQPTVRRTAFAAAAALLLVTLNVNSALGANTAYTSDATKPDVVSALRGFDSVWKSSGVNDLHGVVLDPATLSWNDRVASWINQNSTAKQQFKALQGSSFVAPDGSGYDPSTTIADGFGKKLGAIYVQGRATGQLPLTSALVNNTNGSAGAYLGTGSKAVFSYPRPFLNVDPTAAAVPGDLPGCAASVVNASSLAPNRQGKSWVDNAGNLKITRVAPATDSTREFAGADVKLDALYWVPGLCASGSYPSGHSLLAYQSGITLATLVPELAPSLLARASEVGNNRIILGVHYPLDVIGGRIVGETAIAARWSDPEFRAKVLLPARSELVQYLEAKCGARLAVCISKDRPYSSNPFAGARTPIGTSQIVSDRKSALKVYTERLSYGFKAVGSTRMVAAVPTGAENLLLTTFPTLTDAQRKSVLAQTQIASGHPLDTSASFVAGSGTGSWQRLNLAAAMSATVKVAKDGTVRVLEVGGKARVVPVKEGFARAA